MKVVVTGGAGFIGANVCRALARHEAVSEVVVIDDLSTGHRANLDDVEKVELQVASILASSDLMSVISNDVSSIIHLAARPSVPRSIEDPSTSHEVNATGTVRVLEAARAAGVPHVVVASSSSVYGGNTELPKREDAWVRPLSPYAASKLATESYALAYASSFQMKVLALRFFNVFGPFQRAGHAYAAVVPAFVTAALNGEQLQIHGDGKQTRDFTYVGTVAEVISQAVMRQVQDPSPVNLAYGERTSLLTLIGLLESILERPLDVAFCEPRKSDVRDSQAANQLLTELFPEVSSVGLEEGLRRTIEWLQRDLTGR